MTDDNRTKSDANDAQVKEDAQNTFEKASGHKPPAGKPPEGGQAPHPGNVTGKDVHTGHKGK